VRVLGDDAVDAPRHRQRAAGRALSPHVCL
jgi:hypothetical protein